MRTNISDNLLKELKQSHNTGAGHRKALTMPEQELFRYFLNKENTPYHHWKPIFTVMLYTGMRVGEITGLRWEDIDMDEDLIEVNHTLVYSREAMSQVTVLARIFGECREGQIPRSSAALQI